ncbi:DUF4157 domain-containing protein [Streptomyces sp. NPDC091271]|uniref:eCIS core domain-containing protein n=1 Tax=Streptomyces sp. NPDC091271 TaxID=3365980 RepID=UPI00381B8E45
MRAHETPAPQPGDRSKPRRTGAPSTQAGRMLALQRTAGNAAVSRAIEEERHAHGPGCGHGEAAPSGEQSAVQRRVSVQEAISSPGSRPEPRILDKAQQAYGMSFDHVRLHTGPVAQRSAMEFNAVAYTTGSDIVSQKPHLDDETIFHELDHVRQQTMGPVAGTDNGAGAKVSHQDDPFEKQSAANGRKLAQGGAPDLSLPGSSAPVQRAVEFPGADTPEVQRVASETEEAPAKYQQTKPSAPEDRDVTLRMLDRMSRIALETITKTNSDYTDQRGNPQRGKSKITPHLAVSLLPGGQTLAIAGNTGEKRVTDNDKSVVEAELRKYVDGTPEMKHAKERDRTKLKALTAGDYSEGHGNAPGLIAVGDALRRPIQWFAVGGTESGKSSQHGEMTVLGQHVAGWVANPNTSGDIEQVMMGGVKKACASCQWAFEAVNEHIGRPNGYEVQASGTHAQFFPGWRMPEWMKAYPKVVAEVEAQAGKIGAKLENGVLQGAMTDKTVGHNPDSSDSEWDAA